MSYKFNLKKVMSKMMMISLCGVTIVEDFYVNNVNAIEKEIIKSTNIDTWVSKAPMPTGKKKVASVVVDGKIYCIGGQGGFDFNDVQMYDPETDTWETKTPMPTERYGLVSVVLNGRIYCIGGYNGTSYFDTVEVYDPKTDSWETKRSMPTKRSALSGVVVNGKIYCIGGRNGSNESGLDNVEVYDPVTDTWETKTSMPTARTALASVVVDDKIYCIGGYDGACPKDVEVYNPTTNSWEVKTSIPTPRMGLSSVVVGKDIYCIGGFNVYNSGFDKVEVYNTQTNTWTTKTSLSTKRRNLSSVVLDGKIYCFGGKNSSILDSVEMYTTEEAIEIEKEKEKEKEAEDAVGKAEQTRDPQTIEDAKDLVNQLPESDKKNELLDRLDRLIPKSMTSNIDVYIKPESVLSLSVNTNSVTFEDFDGVEDIEIQNAITLTVESTLPYEVNSSLETEIQNSDGTEILDKSLLNIKANEKSNYNTFPAIKTPIVLLDVQDVSQVNNHGIDLRLNKAIVPNIDVYKTTIKFEIKQK